MVLGGGGDVWELEEGGDGAVGQWREEELIGAVSRPATVADRAANIVGQVASQYASATIEPPTNHGACHERTERGPGEVQVRFR